MTHLEDEQHDHAPPPQQPQSTSHSKDGSQDATKPGHTRPPARFSVDPTRDMPGSFDFGNANDGEGGEGGFFAKLAAHFGSKKHAHSNSHATSSATSTTGASGGS